VLGPLDIAVHRFSTAVLIDPTWRGSRDYALAALVQEGVDSDSGEKAIVITFTNRTDRSFFHLDGCSTKIDTMRLRTSPLDDIYNCHVEGT
jgi:hypothetical protein